ncbi:MAG TPA: RDD family protein [Candidatus Micrarchaeia archaeon]|nr:RDD family protein [Candidatus Micrarchaeia archaeon]
MLDQVSIRTPESVTLEVAVAGIGSRFLAAVLDTLAILLVEAVLIFAVVAVLGSASHPGAGGPLLIVLVVVASLVPIAYYVVFELAAEGRSLGKMALGLRVVRLDGVPVGAAESLVRNIVRLLDFLPVAYGVGVCTMFVARNSRRLGDLAAGTVVIRERTALADPGTASAGVPVLTVEGPGAPVPGVERGGAAELGLLRAYLGRGDLAPARRRVLATEIAAGLCTRWGSEPAAIGPEPADLWLQRVYLQLHARLYPGSPPPTAGAAVPPPPA